MAPSQSAQLDNIIDEVLKSGNRHPLEAFLERYTDKEVPVKCSQKFLSKLDKLITKSLDQKDARTASLAVAIIYKCGKNLNLPGGRGLSGLITQELMNKWFEKCKHLWIQHGPRWDETMFTLSENFLNALMVTHESCREGTFKVTEFFLYPIGQLAVDPKIYILIQKEAIRKYNLILDKIPVEFKKTRRILTSQEAADLMAKLATRILEGGDYDLQSSLMEALCRMATAEQRKKLASRWFGIVPVASAFAQINDSEFETACRGFLNMVNGMQGDRRRVYSYPCLEVYLGKNELLKPSDEKLGEFWIDFNLGSHSISFYFSLSDEEESHWETICINENEVQSYTVTEEGKRKVLQIKLSEVVVIGAVEGSSLTIQFSSSLDILQAAQSVYGLSVVPESQVSYGESEKNPAPYVLPALTAPVQMVTPARIMLSESTVCISSCERGTTRSVSSLVLKPPDKDRSSVEKKILVAEAKQVGVTGQEEENSQDYNFVPDTQPKVRDNVSFSKNNLSVSEILMMPTQKMGSAPRPVSNLRVMGQLERCPSSAQRWSVSDSDLVLQRKLHSELTQRLDQVLTERKKDPQYQEESACQTNASKSRGNSKDRGSGIVPGSSLQSPKVKRVRRNDQRKCQRTLEADTVPEETSDKTSAGKTNPNRKESKFKEKVKMALFCKEQKDADVTASMMKRISSHYEINTQSKAKDTGENTIPIWNPPLINSRAVFTMSMVFSGRKEAPKDASLRKSFTKTTTDSVRNIEDIFAFNNDSPVGIGDVNRTLNKTFDTSKSSSACLSTNNKAQPKPVAKKKRYVKEHLFSDTDTDNAPTEVSWLRKSARRSKPQVTKYPKQALKKPKAASPSSLHKFPDFLPSVQKDSEGIKKPNKAQNPPKMVEQAPRRPHAAGRRSRQAAASSTKSYQEPDTDDNQSEAEKPQPPKYMSTDDLKNSEKIQGTVQTKMNTTTSKPTSKKLQSLKLQLDPASETPPPAKTHRGGLQENKEKFGEDLQMKKTVNMSEESYRRTDTISRADSKNQNNPKAQQVKPGKALHKTLKLNKKSVVNAREETSALKDSLAASQTSFCLSPPPIERMRSVERSAPTLDLTFSTVLTPRGSPLPASPKPPCQETPSPIPLLPKLHSAVGSKEKHKPSSLHKAKKGHRSSKIQFIKSIPSPCSVGGQTPALTPPPGPGAAEMCAVQQHLSSALPSPLFTQPLLTSSLLALDQPPVALPPLSPLAENSISQGCHLEFSNMSSLSLGASSQSLALSRKSKERSMAAMIDSSKSEKTPLTDKGTELSQPFVSGPTRKRRVSLSSHSDEDETEQKVKSRKRRQNSPRMKPRKLFESFTEMSTTDELSHIRSFNWEAEEAGGDVGLDEDLELPPTGLNTSDICHQWGSELKKKFQSQCNIMESYNKQSLKTVQQHVTSINVKLCKYRNQKLEQVKKVLLEEIHNLEQDDVLKNMEKDLNSHWKKQMTAFHSHQKQETRRIDTLRGTLGPCQSLESEETIFSSEMDLVRKEMKSCQDRLLNEMLEGEIQSVKRGLHALFFP